MLEDDGVFICYWLPNDSTYTFEEALKHCKENNGHLAIVDSEKKTNHLVKYGVLKSTHDNK